MARINTRKQVMWEACTYTEDGEFDPTGFQRITKAEAEKDVRKYPGSFLVKATFERVSK